MNQLPTLSLPLIPYAQASPAQLAQALLTARDALGISYREITGPQWYEAFTYFQPLLIAEPNQVNVTAEGLMAIAQYFDTRYPSLSASSLPHASAVPLPALERVPDTTLPPALPYVVKRTYLLHLDVLTSLERVSFWRRARKSDLVNLAVQQLMATYSESQIPLPLTEV
jgi:hypothetical protein